MKRAETPYKRGVQAAEREFKKRIRPVGAIKHEQKIGGNVRRFFVGYNAFYEKLPPRARYVGKKVSNDS